MQLKFITLGLSVAVLMTVVNAGDTVSVKNTRVGVHDVANNPLRNLNINDVLYGANINVASSKKRGLSMSKTVATALRRRAIARRSEEADENDNEADEDEADEDEVDEDEADEDEWEEDEYEEDEDEEDEDEYEEDENEYEADENEGEYDENEDESAEDEGETWERRDLLGSNGLPIVGDLLGGGKKSGSGGVLGGAL